MPETGKAETGGMSGEDRATVVAALARMGLLSPGEPADFTPLTGGVSSDIHLVTSGARRFCIKRALARLKVAAVWEAPVARNAAEAAWLRKAGAWLPHAAPAVLGEDPALGLFAMAYLPPQENPVWKTELLAGTVDLAFAATVGRDLATIHAASARDPSVPAAFAHDTTFEPIRIEPYLLATARACPEVAGPLEALAARTLATKRALVHGDVSPKNILHGAQGPVFLDAECAWYGDPAFDLAFCLNHLLLKGARAGVERAPYLAAYEALARAYLAGVDWEPAAELEARAASLLPGLFLARIDGKSPLEYLTRDAEKDAVRRCAIPLLRRAPARLSEISSAWATA
jgi:aminoglycoside phosphotransferase (APT) family kinase protein